MKELSIMFRIESLESYRSNMYLAIFVQNYFEIRVRWFYTQALINKRRKKKRATP